MKKNEKTIIISLAIVFVITGYFLFLNFGSQLSNDSLAPTMTSPPVEPNKTFEMVVMNNTIQYLSTGEDEFSLPGYLRANEGDVVTINITVDEDNELVLHDYDASVEVKKDEMAELTFTADKVGLFNLGLIHTNTDLGVIEVFPLDS